MKRYFYFLAYPLAEIWWRITHPTSSGTKIILQDGSKILLVKNTYGATPWNPKLPWNLPGGGIEKGETPQQGARRELAEELGIDLNHLKLIGNFLYTGQHKKDTIYVFHAEVKDPFVRLQQSELSMFDWFSLHNLPDDLANAAKQALKTANLLK